MFTSRCAKQPTHFQVNKNIGTGISLLPVVLTVFTVYCIAWNVVFLVSALGFACEACVC